MKIHAKSEGYIDISENIERERRYRELWRFSYIARHLYLEPTSNENEAQYLDLALDVIESIYLRMVGDAVVPDQSGESKSTTIGKFVTGFTEFTDGLIYALHRRETSDGFMDLRFEITLPVYLDYLSRIFKNELIYLTYIYNRSRHFGFSFIELLLPQYSDDLLKEYIDFYPNESNQSPYFPRLTLPIKNHISKGVQISVKPYESSITNNWNLAIYYNESHVISHIRQKLKEVWELEDVQSIGDKDNFLIAIYVDRKACTPRYALSTLEHQVSWHALWKSGRILPNAIMNGKPANNGEDPHTYDYQPKIYRKINEAIKISEGLNEKRWTIPKNNIRRAIALVHWDEINGYGKYDNPYEENHKISRKLLINNTIKSLRKNKPSILSLYHENYNKPSSINGASILGDHQKIHDTVVREMEADYDLTEHCIKEAKYFKPHDMKNSNFNSKKSRKN